jgi:hypothetical protein
MEKIRIRDPGWKKVGSGIRDPKAEKTSRIRNTAENAKKSKRDRRST